MGDALRLMMEDFERNAQGLEKEPLSRAEMHRVNKALKAVVEAADRPDEKHPDTWWGYHKEGVDLGGEKVLPQEAQRATLTDKERRAFDLALGRSKLKHQIPIEESTQNRINAAHKTMSRFGPLAQMGEIKPLGIGPSFAGIAETFGAPKGGRRAHLSEKQRAQYDEGVAAGSASRVLESIRESNPGMTEAQAQAKAREVMEGGLSGKLRHAPGVAMTETVLPAAFGTAAILSNPLLKATMGAAGGGMAALSGLKKGADLATRTSVAIGSGALGLGAYEGIRSPQEDELLADKTAGSLRARLERASGGLLGGAVLGAVGGVARGLGGDLPETTLRSVFGKQATAASRGIAAARAGREFVAQFGEGAGYSLAQGHFDIDQLMVDSTLMALGGGIHGIVSKAREGSRPAAEALKRAAADDKKVAAEIKAARVPHEFERAMADFEGQRRLDDVAERMAGKDAAPPPGHAPPNAGGSADRFGKTRTPAEQVKAEAMAEEEMRLRRFRESVSWRMKHASPEEKLKFEGLLGEIDRRLGNLAAGNSNDETVATRARAAEQYRPEQKLLEGAEAREELADAVAAKPFEGVTGPAADARGGPATGETVHAELISDTDSPGASTNWGVRVTDKDGGVHIDWHQSHADALKALEQAKRDTFQKQIGSGVGLLDSGSLTARGAQWSEAQVKTLRKALGAARNGASKLAGLESMSTPEQMAGYRTRVETAKHAANKLLIERYGKGLDEIAKLPHDSDAWSTDPVLAAVRAEFMPFPDRATGGVTAEQPKGFVGALDPVYANAVFGGDIGGDKFERPLDEYVREKALRNGLGEAGADALVDMAIESANFRLASMKPGMKPRDVQQQVLAHVNRDIIGNFGTTLLRKLKARDRGIVRMVAEDPDLGRSSEEAIDAARRLTWDEKHDPIAEIAASREQMANELRKAGATEDEVVDALNSAAWSSIVDHAKASAPGESAAQWQENARGHLARVLSEASGPRGLVDANDPKTAVAWELFQRELAAKALGSSGRPKRGQTAANVSPEAADIPGRTKWSLARLAYEKTHGDGSWLKLTNGERKNEADAFKREVEPTLKAFRRVAKEIGVLAAAGIETRRGRGGEIVYLNTGLGSLGRTLGDAFAGLWSPRTRAKATPDDLNPKSHAVRPSDVGAYGKKQAGERWGWLRRTAVEALTGQEATSTSDIVRHAMEIEVKYRKSLAYRIAALEAGPLKPLIGANEMFRTAFIDLAEGFARHNNGEPVTDPAQRKKWQEEAFAAVGPEQAEALRTAFNAWRGIRAMYRKRAAKMREYRDADGNLVKVDPDRFGIDDYFPRISLGRKKAGEFKSRSAATDDPSRKAWNPFLQHRSGELQEYALQPAEIVRSYMASMEKSFFDHEVRQRLDPRINGRFTPLHNVVMNIDSRAEIAAKLNEWHGNKEKPQRDVIKYDGRGWVLAERLHPETGGISLQLVGDPAQTTLVPWSQAGRLKVLDGGLEQVMSTPRFRQVERWRDHLLGRHEPTTLLERGLSKFTAAVSHATLGARVGTAQAQTLGHLVMGNAAIGTKAMLDGTRRFLTSAGQRQLRNAGIPASGAYHGGGSEPLKYYSKVNRATRALGSANMLMFDVAEKARGAIYLGAYHQEKARIAKEGLTPDQVRSANERGHATGRWEEIAAHTAGIAAMGRAQALYLHANTPGLLRTPLGKAVFALWRFPMMAGGEAMRMARRDPQAAARYVAGASMLAYLYGLLGQDVENVTGTTVRNLSLPFVDTKLGEAIPALGEDGEASIFGSMPTPTSWRFDTPITLKTAGEAASFFMAAGKALLSDDPEDSIAFDAEFRNASDTAAKHAVPGYDLAQRLSRALELEAPFMRAEKSGDPLKPWSVLGKDGTPVRLADREMFMRELLLPGRPKESVRSMTEYLKDKQADEFETKDRGHKRKILMELQDRAERTGKPGDYATYLDRLEEWNFQDGDIARSAEMAKELPWVRAASGRTTEGRFDVIARRWKDREKNAMTPHQLGAALNILIRKPENLDETRFQQWVKLAEAAGMMK